MRYLCSVLVVFILAAHVQAAGPLARFKENHPRLAALIPGAKLRALPKGIGDGKLGARVGRVLGFTAATVGGAFVPGVGLASPIAANVGERIGKRVGQRVYGRMVRRGAPMLGRLAR